MRAHVLDSFADQYITFLGAKVCLKRFRLEHVPDGPSIRLDLLLWDICSQRGFRKPLMDAYAQGTCGILAVTDMTRRKTLEEMGDWIRDVEHIVGDVPVVVVGANRDSAGAQEVSEEDICSLAEAYGASCFFASANSQQPVEEALTVLAERIASRRFRTDRSR